MAQRRGAAGPSPGCGEPAGGGCAGNPRGGCPGAVGSSSCSGRVPARPSCGETHREHPWARGTPRRGGLPPSSTLVLGTGEPPAASPGPRVSMSSGERKALLASLKSLGVVSRPRPTTSQAAFSFSLFRSASWQTAPRELYPCRALLIHFVSRTSKPACTTSRTVCSGDLAQGGSKGRGRCFPPSPRSWLSSPMEQQQQQQRGGAPRRCPPTAVALPPFPTAAQPGGLPVPRDKRCGAPAVQHLAFWRGVKRSPPPGADFCHSTRSRSGSPGPSAVHVSGPRGCYLASCELHSSPLASARPVLTN